jgi:mannose-6-phosphate isomerase-like protein (cupin superfamily)
MFETARLGPDPDATAPDGSAVRILLAAAGASTAHFELGPGEVSVAVRHRTVEEIWFFVAGRGRFWRRLGDEEATVGVEAGTCVTIPCGTAFQFRADGATPLAAVAVTLPPWPGDGEAVEAIGPWTPTVAPGPGLGAADAPDG